MSKHRGSRSAPISNRRVGSTRSERSLAVVDAGRAHHEVAQFEDAPCRHPVVGQRGQQGVEVRAHTQRELARSVTRVELASNS